MNDTKYILIACEESQTECLAFRQLGAFAYSCDLQPCSGGHPEWHIQGNALKVIHPGEITFHTQIGEEIHVPEWSLIIAHPPCTYLSTVGAACLYPTKGVLDRERYEKGVEAAKFFMRFYNVDFCPIAVENPRPFPYFGLPKHSDIISPHMFGSKWSKRTYLWLKKLPVLLPTCINPHPKSWVATKKGSFIRSKSFPEVAKAMAEQWLPLI